MNMIVCLFLCLFVCIQGFSRPPPHSLTNPPITFKNGHPPNTVPVKKEIRPQLGYKLKSADCFYIKLPWNWIGTSLSLQECSVLDKTPHRWRVIHCHLGQQRIRPCTLK